MSIEKSISSTLSNLIAEANYTIESVKEKILAAYNYAVGIDKYTPQEAAKVLRENLTFSKDYIRHVLPIESKESKFANKKTDDNEAVFEPPSTGEELEDGIVIPDENEKRDPDKIEIKTAYEILEGESEPEQQQFVPNTELEEFRKKQGNQTQEQTAQYINKTEYETTKQQLQEEREKVQVVTKQRDKAELEKEKLDTQLNGIFSGESILELKDQIIPVKYSFVILPKQKLTLTFDSQKTRR